jgi:[NiFe] hydrogenase diaphorase moiety small subunit
LTPASNGLQVQNQTDELQKWRLQLLQMLFVEGNHYCPSCEASGQCRLQAMAYHLGMTDSDLDHWFARYPLDASHPEALLDLDRCIHCGLCIRASNELDQKGAFIWCGRGVAGHLAASSTDGCLGGSTFSAEDQAAHICPTGAIVLRQHYYERKPGQRFFDQTQLSQAGEVPLTSLNRVQPLTD